MNFKVGDKVVVITGKDKGKEGKIISTDRKNNRVVVEGINMIKKHVKPANGQPGSIEEREASIHASNVMIVDPKTGKRTRIGHTTNKDKKVRVTKKSNANLD